jgi:myo-inositol 2-dehydrogenase/D-chiro-inositol 1-dehydrogenase
MTAQSSHERRTFLKAAGGALLLNPRTVFGYQANSTVEVGLVGCGNRGNWIAPFFTEQAGARVVAVADVIKERLDSTRQKLAVEEGRAYYGPDAYHELAQSKLDAVIIETPPYFHTMEAAAAVDAGKHVYCAKPVAADVPDCRAFLAAGQKAQSKGLSFWVDFQSRAIGVYLRAVAPGIGVVGHV